jgi:hypothetical protein
MKRGRKKIDPEQKKIALTYYVQTKNKASIDAKVRPIVEKMDDR